MLKMASNFVLGSGKSSTYPRGTPRGFLSPAASLASRFEHPFESLLIVMEFTEDQITRYSRHILLPEVGGKGQKKIAKAKILLVGAGGLGSPAALYLAAAGIGTIGLIDSDVVDLTNLHRQILHHTSDVGRPKVVSGKEKIQALNPDVRSRCTKSGLSPRALPARRRDQAARHQTSAGSR